MQTKNKVLLCLPKWRGRNHGFFLGIAALATSLQKAGIETAVYDDDLASYAANKEHCNHDNLLEQFIIEYKPTIIGLHINTPNYEEALSLARKIRKLTDIPIVAGGPHATVAARIILARHKEINFALKGEADYTLPILAKQIFLNKQLNIPNLVQRKNGYIVESQTIAPIQMSMLDFPNRNSFLHPPLKILSKWASIHYQNNFYSTIRSFDGRKATNIYASRGCIRSCPFCFPGNFWMDHTQNTPVRRIRSVKNLMDEIAMLRDLGYGAIYFDETAFPFDQNTWLLEFADKIKELDMYWGGAAIFHQVHKAPLKYLAKCGLRYLYFGLETPIGKLQKKINKELSAETAREFIDFCFDIGIQCDVSIFFGIPGETDTTISKTIEWINTNLRYGNAFFSIAAIWPGTRWAEIEGLGPECWEPDYDKNTAPGNVVWYDHKLTSIGQFFSNSLGTYHPAFMTPERALKIKESIIKSGFRARFAQYARRRR